MNGFRATSGGPDDQGQFRDSTSQGAQTTRVKTARRFSNPMFYGKEMNREGLQQCSACASPHRLQIDNAMAAKRPYKWITKSFSVSSATLSRHRAHLPPDLLPAAAIKGQDVILRAVDVHISELQRLSARMKRGKDAMESAKMMLAISRELRSWIQLRAQLAARTPVKPITHDDVEISDAQAQSVAEIILARSKGKKANENT